MISLPARIRTERNAGTAQPLASGSLAACGISEVPTAKLRLDLVLEVQNLQAHLGLVAAKRQEFVGKLAAFGPPVA